METTCISNLCFIGRFQLSVTMKFPHPFISFSTYWLISADYNMLRHINFIRKLNVDLRVNRKLVFTGGFHQYMTLQICSSLLCQSTSIKTYNCRGELYEMLVLCSLPYSLIVMYANHISVFLLYVIVNFMVCS